ncbi:hypothetical protein AHF37_02801 [Paragonimus kellicotti]|nr:hypothetical protein AHF37_02801 [Paragonimus kellicotti]
MMFDGPIKMTNKLPMLFTVFHGFSLNSVRGRVVLLLNSQYLNRLSNTDPIKCHVYFTFLAGCKILTGVEPSNYAIWYDNNGLINEVNQEQVHNGHGGV